MNKELENRFKEIDSENEAVFVRLSFIEAQIDVLQTTVWHLLDEVLEKEQAKAAKRVFLENTVQSLKGTFESLIESVDNQKDLLLMRSNVYHQLRDLARSWNLDPDLVRL